MRSVEIGCTRIWTRDDPNAWLLHPDHYEYIKAAWMRGEAFYIGTDCYGDEMVVKLGAVIVISLATPEAMAAANEDAKADRLLDDEPST